MFFSSMCCILHFKFFWLLEIKVSEDVLTDFCCNCRDTQAPPLSDKDQEERTMRIEFVQGLLLSTIIDDGL